MSKTHRIKINYLIDGSEHPSLIMVDQNSTVAEFLDKVKESQKNDDLMAVFLNGRKLDLGDLLRNYTKDTKDLFVVSDDPNKEPDEITNTGALVPTPEDEVLQKVEEKVKESITKVTATQREEFKMKNNYQIYTTASLESMTDGHVREFRLRDTFNTVRDTIMDLIRGLDVDDIPDDFEILIYLPGGIPFVSGSLEEWYDVTDVAHHRLYVVITRPIGDIIDSEIPEPCNSRNPFNKVALSPLYNSTQAGLDQIACFLGYLFHEGTNAEHLLLVLAKITRFAPLIVNIFRVLEHASLNVSNIVAITGPLYTLFRATLPKGFKSNQVFERTLNLITFIGLITDTNFLHLNSLDWEDDPPADDGEITLDDEIGAYCREHGLQHHIVLWEEDTINPGFEGYNLLAPDDGDTIEAIMEAIPTYRPVSPLTLHFIYSPTFVKAPGGGIMLYIDEVPGRPNFVRFINPTEGVIREANLDDLARAVGDTSIDNFASLIDAERVEQLVFICFDESMSMKWKLEGGNTRGAALSRAQISTRYLEALLDQAFRLRVNSIFGLISFGSHVVLRQGLTPIASEFNERLKEITPGGQTLLWDALKNAHDLLVSYNSNEDDDDIPNYPNAKLRIIVITDGADNKSTTLPEDLANDLIDAQITVDTVLVSLTDQNLECCALSKLTGGLTFRPNSLEEGLKIFEQEAFMNISTRRCVPFHTGRVTADTISNMAKRFRDYDDEAPNQEVASAKHDIILSSPLYALYQYSTKQPETLKKRRALKELNIIAHNPDPSYVVYSSHATPEEWRIFIRGPERSPFEGKWLNLFMKLPPKYPVKPPVFRFLTIPFHPNVSHEGRVFFSLIDNMYTPQSGIDAIITGIVNLLENPELDNPINKIAADLFRRDRAAYTRQQRADECGEEDYHAFINMKVYDEVPATAVLTEEQRLSQLYVTNTLHGKLQGKELPHPDPADMYD
ncbi:hypothetical protein TRFO_41707 [Tritrichomonas foetus]|uniref:Ubiquitin-conjugating enzyme family protein n=1 Tax=Tritrichomonas foetus TaxID=1144522 RepID=A0A1J4L3P5_9EUKA|nr:hypothetical protein TRFO_41707 [Tritrichomonas foetus]|eukprot:OHT16596.1 hypothetical protein TRFO_41707 [Tritrichomonas foetus]